MYKTIDLFAGIGGIRLGFEAYNCKNVFSSEWDKDAQAVYEANFNEKPHGDINLIDPHDIPDHDILLAGFPCQPFSIAGKGLGFADTRGTLFFNIEAILKAKKPRAFLLENVKRLTTHDNGQTFAVIVEKLKALGYTVYTKVFNSLDFGVPQKRERIYLVGFLEPLHFNFPTPLGYYQPLTSILQEDSEIPQSYFLSDTIRQNRLNAVKGTPPVPSIWHQNIGGNISALPYSCALRAGGSYNYLVVNGVRRLTDREMLRLQGFPDDFKITIPYSGVRKVAGNSVSVPVIKAIAGEMVKALQTRKTAMQPPMQFALYESKNEYLNQLIGLDFRVSLNCKNNNSFFYENYEILSFEIYSSGEEKLIGNKGSFRKCRFCKKDGSETTFSNVSHAIPQALGNKRIILLDECDSCNKFFSEHLEDHFGKYTRPYRTFSRIKGSKNKIPSYKSKDGFTTISVNKEQKDIEFFIQPESNIVFDELSNSIKITLDFESHIPVAVYKTLVKMALSLIEDETELLAFQGTIRWLLEKDHSIHAMLPLTMQTQFIENGEAINGGFVCLFRRKEGCSVPYAIFIIGFRSWVYQIHVPSYLDIQSFGVNSLSFSYLKQPYFYMPCEKIYKDEVDLSNPEKQSFSKTWTIKYEAVEDIPTPLL